MKFIRNSHHSLEEAAIASNTRASVDWKPLLDLPSTVVVCLQLTSWAWNGYKEEDTEKDNKSWSWSKCVYDLWISTFLLKHDFNVNEYWTYLTCLHVYLSQLYFLGNNSFIICRPLSYISIISPKIYIQTKTLIMKP